MHRLIINHILSSISMRDAMRTKILSKQRRNELSSLPNLDFNEYSYYLNILVVIFIFMASTISRLNEWISYAVSHNVQNLRVKIYLDIGQVMGGGNIRLPPLLFTSTSLTTLVLILEGRLLVLPANIQFPNLKSLRLEWIEFFDDNSIARFFSSCPLLEKISIISCNMNRLN
ncbi:hypothetical protein GIB67_005142 [Kingdonia uniflora]|uniref:F-box/LRR-repeat protein 15/At3g58940/PEG3-like LRR domain-containing protein n=1 Tax=Kingdonia uniflora TaxID=39325 RepID=A0A7J7LA46_9MAGN|nr:hypothetical protein GIB67_005142 [Kingdonia uniflora]